MVVACIIGRVEILQESLCCGYTVLVVTPCGRGLEILNDFADTHHIIAPDLLWFGEAKVG